MPRFGLPRYTRPTGAVLEAAGVELPDAEPLPQLIEPEPGEVTDPDPEPLAPIRHRRIRVLANYWHGGWGNARADCWLRTSVVDRLGTAAENLPSDFGLAVFDAWRPLPLQAELYESAYRDPDLPPGFVSPADDDPTTPPPHLTGGTVDLTLTVDGEAVGAGTGFDDFTARARTDALEATPGPDRAARRLLYWAMRDQGFVVLDCEWWHFEHGTRRWAGLTGHPAKYGPAEPATGQGATPP